MPSIGRVYILCVTFGNPDLRLQLMIGNCTKWNAIWSEIKRVITNQNLHDKMCNFHFIAFILKSTSGNTSWLTKYAKSTPELAPFNCNIPNMPTK